MLTGHGRIWEVSLIATCLTEDPIGILVRWSLKRGGRFVHLCILSFWLIYRLLCSYNELAELGGYIVQGECFE